MTLSAGRKKRQTAQRPPKKKSSGWPKKRRPVGFKKKLSEPKKPNALKKKPGALKKKLRSPRLCNQRLLTLPSKNYWKNCARSGSSLREPPRRRMRLSVPLERKLCAAPRK
jgi:hypothetical protein